MQRSKFDFPVGEGGLVPPLSDPLLQLSLEEREMGCCASAVVGLGYRSALAKKVRASRQRRPTMLDFGFCILLWSGWRGFGPVRVDWLLQYRRTGGNRVGNIKRIRREGLLQGTVNKVQKVRLLVGRGHFVRSLGARGETG